MVVGLLEQFQIQAVLVSAFLATDAAISSKLTQLGRDILGRVETAAALVLPDVADLLQYTDEANVASGHGGARARPIGPPEDRFQVGGDEDIQWPAARAGGGLHIIHIYAVDVGPLFTVNLDRNEGVVEDGGNVRVLEGLALHDMAPVAGSIANADEDEPVCFSCKLQGAGPPHLPCDRIVHMAAHLHHDALLAQAQGEQAVALASALTYGLLLSCKRLTSFRPSPDTSLESILEGLAWRLTSGDEDNQRGATSGRAVRTEGQGRYAA